MAERASLCETGSGGFGWRDAWAFARAFPRIALRRKPHLAMTALARVSAIDVRRLPRQHFFRASDGGEIAFRTYEGRGDLHLVLIHGSACFGDQFHAMAARLSGEKLATVHTLDMRGHGKSTSKIDGYWRFGQDVREFCASLKGQRSDRRIVLGGHSAGGGLVINIARGRGFEGIDGWLLLSPFMAIADRSVRPYFGGWVSKFRRTLFMLVIAANALRLRRFNNFPLLEFDRETFLHDPRYAREWSFDSIFGFGPGAARSLRRTIDNVPVLLIAGDRDDCFVEKEYPRALAEVAPSGEYRMVDGLGHWDVLVDAQALDLCGDWLREKFPDAHGIIDQEEKDVWHANFAR